MRLCYKCNKKTTFFYKNRPIWYVENSKSLCGRCYQKKNKSKVLASAKKYRETHTEIIKEKQKIYDKTPQGKERHNRWRRKNPEKVKKSQVKWSNIYQGLRYKGKQISLGYNPRKGFCLDCGKSGFTNLHHEKYDDENPLNYTVELCIACHNLRHPRGRNELGQFV